MSTLTLSRESLSFGDPSMVDSSRYTFLGTGREPAIKNGKLNSFSFSYYLSHIICTHHFLHVQVLLYLVDFLNDAGLGLVVGSTTEQQFHSTYTLHHQTVKKNRSIMRHCASSPFLAINILCKCDSRPRITTGLIRALTVPPLTLRLSTVLTCVRAKGSATLALTILRPALDAMSNALHLTFFYPGISGLGQRLIGHRIRAIGIRHVGRTLQVTVRCRHRRVWVCMCVRWHVCSRRWCRRC